MLKKLKQKPDRERRREKAEKPEPPPTPWPPEGLGPKGLKQWRREYQKNKKKADRLGRQRSGDRKKTEELRKRGVTLYRVETPRESVEEAGFPSLSIVVNTYNRKDVLAKTLDALLPQLRGKDEVIVCDDGSDDGTRDMVETRFKGIAYLTQTHRGYRLSRSRNNGIMYAGNPFIVMLNDDCVPDEGFLEAYRCEAKKGVLLLGGLRFQLKNGRHRKRKVAKDPVLTGELEGGYGGNICFNKQDAEAVGLFTEEYDGYWGYDDSVTGDTPILIRRQKKFIDFMEIEELFFDCYYNENPIIHLTHKQISPQIEVYSSKGWSKINYAVRKYSSKQIYVVDSSDGITKVTGCHSLFKNGKEIKPIELKKGDIIDQTSFIDANKYSSITEEFARLLGFFLAEGTALIDPYRFYVGVQDKEALLKYQRTLEGYFGYSFKIYDTLDSSQVYRIICNRKKIAKFFRRMCYTRRGNKKVPMIILNSNQNILRAFMEGYLEGDGFEDKSMIRSETISFILAAGLRYIWSKLGYKRLRTKYFKKDDRNDVYQLSIQKTGNYRLKGIKNIIPIDNEGIVYDISTENETFVGGINQIIHHNTDFIVKMRCNGVILKPVEAAKATHQYHKVDRNFVKAGKKRNKPLLEKRYEEYRLKIFERIRKKILYVIEWSVIGGAGVVLKRILDNIDRSLYKTDVCVVGKRGDLHDAFASDSRVFSLEDSEDKYGDLKKLIEEEGYDVVQLYTMMDYIDMVKEIEGPKFICQLNLSLSEHHEIIPRWGDWFHSIQELTPHFHALVSDSSRQLDIKDMQLIRNGVDLTKFKVGRKDPKLVLWVGRISREKGAPVFLDIAREMPDYKFLMIVGLKWRYHEGWRPYQQWLDDAIENRPSNVEIKYGLSEDEVAKWMSRASFYILPSMSESSPVTVTEAMASGCVVFSTNVGDAPNMIRHGIDGFIIPHRDLIDWLADEELVQYHLSPKSRKLDEEIKRYVVDMIPQINVTEIGREARESVKNLIIENQVKQYEFLYGEMGSHRGQTRIAFVWGYPDIAEGFWESKVDSMQHAIQKLSEENCVVLFVPRTKEEYRERAVINGCNIIFYPYNESDKLIPLLKQFNPHVICLNSLHQLVNEDIIKVFPDTYKTIYEYGGLLDDPLLRKIDTLFVQQRFRIKEAQKKSGISPSKIMVNTHGVDTSRFKPVKTKKRYSAVMVADFRRQIKRQHILIEAWKNVPGRLLLIARLNQPSPYGDYEKHCRDLISRHRLKRRVVIRGFVPNKELPALLNQCKIGVMTSSREGGSRAMLEMMACGLPMVVLKDCEGCTNMINPGVDGLVTDQKNLASSLRHLLENPAELARMGSAAVAHIEREHCYSEMLNVFKDVISKARPEVSIITTSMNRGEYLEDCIKSVLTQDNRKFKINHIIMDGGSKDGSLAILKKYENCIHYVYGGDKGQRDAINKAFDIIDEEYPNTSYVGWINADDYYAPRWLSESHGVLSRQSSNVAMTCSDYNAVDMFKKGKTTRLSSLKSEWIEARNLLKGNYVCQPSVLMRKAALDKLKNKYGWYLNPELEYVIDYELWCRFVKEGYKIRNIFKPLTNHRLHSEQMGRTKLAPLKIEWVKVQDQLKRSMR